MSVHAIALSGEALEVLKRKAREYGLEVREEEGVTLVFVREEVYCLLKLVALRESISVQEALMRALLEYV